MAKTGGMFDARTDGIFPLQDFRKPSGVDGVVRLDLRAGLYGARVIKRRAPLGQHIHGQGTVGDLIGASLWEAVSPSKRPIPAWRWITPCVCDDGQEHDEIADVNAYTGPGGEVGKGSRDPYETVNTLGASSRLKLSIDGPGLRANSGVGF